MSKKIKKNTKTLISGPSATSRISESVDPRCRFELLLLYRQDVGRDLNMPLLDRNVFELWPLFDISFVSAQYLSFFVKQGQSY